jgi:hypothetical protein
MSQYIDKSALVAEIKRRMDENRGKQTLPQYFGMIEEDLNILSFIDTLEVKEVDLDFQRFAKEMDAIFALPSSETKNTEEEPLNWEYAIAKHFFELGMQQSKNYNSNEE